MKKTMKNKFIAFAGVVLFSSQVIAQKANETSAAIEYKKYSDAMTMLILSGGSGDMEPAKKALEKAKGFIDLAAVNETTKESPKTLFYKVLLTDNINISLKLCAARENRTPIFSLATRRFTTKLWPHIQLCVSF